MPDLFGYGPPFAYFSRRVKEIADFLDTQTEEQLRAKFTPSAMKKAEPYPAIWDRYTDNDSPEWEGEWTYFFGFFPELQKFVRETADRNLALLLCLT
jgi:hypothetical protein